ncbi:MAG: hypothetical protein JW787_04290 [Sedimentisphaerales bacterium]|nr:hypothetical protein [Sedimentisphaerales bacterium]
MDFSILAQTAGASPGAAGQTIVPVDLIWKHIITLDLIEALTFISFGSVCLLYGWRVFKILVVICFGLIGLILGMTVTGQIVGLNNQLAGGLIGMGVLAVLSVPMMKWGVSLLGAAAGAIMAAAIWYACNLPEQFIWTGALTGLVAGGMISFIIFKVSIMLFTSLGGSILVSAGSMALLYLYERTAPQIQEFVFEKKWFLPIAIIVPTIIGVILQNKFCKDSKDWEI